MSTATKRFEYDVFISYAHKDDHDGWVTALVEAIKVTHLEYETIPLDLFFDTHEIRTMDDWEHRILRGLRHSKVMIAVLSPNYFGSEYCRKEWQIHLDHELDRSMQGEGLASIYTVVVPGFEDEAPAALAEWIANLKRRQFIDVRDWRTHGIEVFQRQEVVRRLQALDKHLKDKIDKAERVVASLSTIPGHNPQFAGRADQIRALHESLAKKRIGAIAAVHGIGGIGKSALAFEYAHNYADEYPGGRFLVPCSTASDLRVPIINLADYLGLIVTPDERKDIDACYARVRFKFESGERALLVLDNVDNPALITPDRLATILPGGDRVHVMITTRIDIDELVGLDTIALDSLPEADAVALLGKYRRFDSEPERAAAGQIARRLGGHPLALEVVAVYLKQIPSVTYVGYAARLEREGLGAIEAAGRDNRVALSRHNQKLISALLEPTLATLSPEERLVLEYASLLPPDRVPLAWLRHMAALTFPDLAADPEPGYEPVWELTLRRLLGLRLLIRSDVAGFVRIHRLMADVVSQRFGADLNERNRGLIAFVRSRAVFLHEGWVEQVARWEIDPIYDYAALLLETNQVEAGIGMANRVYFALQALGKHNEGCSLLRRAVTLGESNPGLDPREFATTLSNLAVVEQAFANLVVARGLFQRSLVIQEKAYAADHPALAVSYSNLATVEQDLGNLVAARGLLESALAIQEKAYAADHPTLAVSYSNLALVEQLLAT
jgi:tetratricopeptide (TPR) repeat protein